MAKKKKLSAEEKKYIDRMESFQQHLPIAEIENKMYKSKTGEYYSIFRMGDRSVDLMTEDEQYQFANVVDTAFQTMGIKSCQLLALPIPFDLQPYLESQEERAEATKRELSILEENLNNIDINDEEYEYVKRKITQLKMISTYLKNQTYFVVKSLQSGQIANKQIYIIPTFNDNTNPIAVDEASITVEQKLKMLAEGSYRCGEQEMKDVLFALFNPLRKDVYNVPSSSITTME